MPAAAPWRVLLSGDTGAPDTLFCAQAPREAPNYLDLVYSGGSGWGEQADADVRCDGKRLHGECRILANKGQGGVGQWAGVAHAVLAKGAAWAWYYRQHGVLAEWSIAGYIEAELAPTTAVEREATKAYQQLATVYGFIAAPPGGTSVPSSNARGHRVFDGVALFPVLASEQLFEINGTWAPQVPDTFEFMPPDVAVVRHARGIADMPNAVLDEEPSLRITTEHFLPCPAPRAAGAAAGAAAAGPSTRDVGVLDVHRCARMRFSGRHWKLHAETLVSAFSVPVVAVYAKEPAGGVDGVDAAEYMARTAVQLWYGQKLQSWLTEYGGAVAGSDPAAKAKAAKLVATKLAAEQAAWWLPRVQSAYYGEKPDATWLAPASDDAVGAAQYLTPPANFEVAVGVVADLDLSKVTVASVPPSSLGKLKVFSKACVPTTQCSTGDDTWAFAALATPRRGKFEAVKLFTDWSARTLGRDAKKTADTYRSVPPLPTAFHTLSFLGQLIASEAVLLGSLVAGDPGHLTHVLTDARTGDVYAMTAAAAQMAVRGLYLCSEMQSVDGGRYYAAEPCFMFRAAGTGPLVPAAPLVDAGLAGKAPLGKKLTLSTDIQALVKDLPGKRGLPTTWEPRVTTGDVTVEAAPSADGATPAAVCGDAWCEFTAADMRQQHTLVAPRAAPPAAGGAAAPPAGDAAAPPAKKIGLDLTHADLPVVTIDGKATADEAASFLPGAPAALGEAGAELTLITTGATGATGLIVTEATPLATLALMPEGRCYLQTVNADASAYVLALPRDGYFATPAGTPQITEAVFAVGSAVAYTAGYDPRAAVVVSMPAALRGLEDKQSGPLADGVLHFGVPVAVVPGAGGVHVAARGGGAGAPWLALAVAAAVTLLCAWALARRR